MKTLSIFSIILLLGSIYLTLPACSTETEAASNTQPIADAIAPPLLQRSPAMADNLEWETTVRRDSALRERLRLNPHDNEAKLILATLFMREARVTGEHPYYYPAAMDLLNQILAEEPKNYYALTSKASVLLSLHHFSDAYAVSREAIMAAPARALAYGAATDAAVELGKYDEAVALVDQMVKIKPELNSYARVSYLRELHGDLAGAVDAMKLAVDAGAPGSEDASWARHELAKLYLNQGDDKNAEVQYMIALEQRPSYAFAKAGLGQIAQIRGNYDEAIMLYEEAIELIPEFSFQDALTDLYLLQGDTQKAKESAGEVVTMLQEDADAGHYADMEQAYAQLKTGNLDMAYKHAKIEYDRRPDNIHTNQAMGWIEYKRGNYKQAAEYIEKALRTNYADPTLNYRAGVIYEAAGKAAEGKKLKAAALEQNPQLQTSLI